MDGKQGSVVIDQQARELAEGWVSDFAQKLGEAEQILVRIGGFCEGEGIEEASLESAIVGAIGISLTEAKQQIRPLHQAVRDMPCTA